MADLEKAKQSINAALDTLKASGPEGLHADAAQTAVSHLEDAVDALSGSSDERPADGGPAGRQPTADVQAVIDTLNGAIDAIDQLGAAGT